MQARAALVPAALALLAVFDLRVEIQLLLDHFTWSALLHAIGNHPLAVAVLVVTPGLIRSNSRRA
jgi:hypothetical protein